MEALVCRASSVVVSYGAMQGRAAGIQETETKTKTKQGISKFAPERTRLVGEKAVVGGSGSGKKFNLAPLPLPSAKSLVPAPLRYLWFPDAKKIEEEEISGSRDGLILDVADSIENSEKEVTNLFGNGNEAKLVILDQLANGAVNLGKDAVLSAPDLERVNGIEGSVESIKSDNGNAAKRWVQSLLKVNFLRKIPRNDAALPSTELPNIVGLPLTSAVEIQDQGSLNPLETGIVGVAGVVGVDAVDTQLQADLDAKDRKAVKCDKFKCIGCASEIGEIYVADSAASPLATLEVPHMSVSHDFESFSKFLSEVPLTELRIIAQSSFLSSIAYNIPVIKPGELARYHHMIFVTSSLDLKAQALAQEKARAIAASMAAATPKSALKDAESEAGTTTKSSFIPTTARSLASAATSFLRSKKNVSNLPTEEGNKDGSAVQVDEVDAADRNDTEATGEGLPLAKNPLQSESMEEFFNSELQGVDMPDFMHPVTSVVSAGNETKQEVANNLRSLHTCPCEWFICDEKKGHTRFFSIQGSDSFASWQANLLFEPVQFEASDLGVMVHRGIYEAAKGLYDQILPYVIEHLQKHGENAKFRFTGHSLGGSLAVLLFLMLNIRGVIDRNALLPVFTFGAPFVMCGGDYLLKLLGFPLTHIQYIVMSRDLVPRAFACNYPDHVAEVLKRVNGTFRNHACLTRQRLLYAPMGQLLVLQPDEKDALPHSLLPSGCGLYLIRHQSNDEPSQAQREGGMPSRAVQVRAAQRAFLNQPHPLEIISDPGAYGPEGSISKHHDPRNYRQVINSVMRHEMKRLRRTQRERRRQLWWPLISADAAGRIAKGSYLGSQKTHRVLKAITSGGNVGPPGFTRYVSDLSAGLSTFPFSASGNLKGRYNRYKSLIASQHVHLAMLVLITAKMYIEEGFSVILAWV